MLSQALVEARDVLQRLGVKDPPDGGDPRAPWVTINLTVAEARKFCAALAKLRESIEQIKRWEGMGR